MSRNYFPNAYSKPKWRKPAGYKWAGEKAYYAKNRERRILNVIEWRRNHKGYLKTRGKEIRERLRADVIQGYGGFCRCCGENNSQFLTIDHVNGDGKADRKQHGGSYGLYQYLIKSGFPRDGYRLLCMNCNWAIRHGDACPHRQVLRLAGVSNG